MAGKFCVSLSCAVDGGDKPTVAFVIATAALAAEKDTLVFLTSEGVRISQRGYADGIHDEGSPPLKDLIANFTVNGGKIFVCTSCFQRRKLDDAQLVPGATIVGGAKLVEFLADGTPCVSF
jgi:predicted peroxiredoxin